MNDHVAPAADTDAPSTAIAEYTETERGLAELRHRLEGRAYDVTTTKGLTEARQDLTEARRELAQEREARQALEAEVARLRAHLGLPTDTPA